MRNHEEIIKRLFKILCRYKEQPVALMEFLLKEMTGKYYPDRYSMYHKGDTVREAFYVSDGYVACLGFDDLGDKQVISIIGKDSIIAGKSFTAQEPSAYEWVCLPGVYVMRVSYVSMKEVYEKFPDAEELARLIMADISDKELERLKLLKRDAETLVYTFYVNHREFLDNPGMMADRELCTYLLISESTLRNVRQKLFKDGKL